MVDLISLSEEFESLNADDIAQNKRKLNNYLAKLQSHIKDSEDFQKFFNMIKPKNDTEQLFKLEIAMVLRVDDFIFNMLKSGNLLLTRRILRSNLLLLNSIFAGISADELVNDVLPSLSYSSKLKFLNRLSKIGLHECLLGDYFDAVQRKYGTVLAQSLLPGCSFEVILDNIKKYNCVLTEPQLYYVIQKNSAFAKEYFQILKQNKKLLSAYPAIMKYLAYTNTELFWSLQEEFHFDGTLGRKTTKKVLENHLSKIQIGEKHMKILHSSAVYTILLKNNILQQFIASFLPEKVEYSYVCLQMEHPLMNFLHKFLQTAKIIQLLEHVFTEKYGVNFCDNIANLDEDVIEVIFKSKIYNEKIRDFVVEKKIIHLQTTDKAIPVYKERLLAAEEEEDVVDIIAQMFESCALNDDKDKLKEIMEFIFQKYRYKPSVLRELFEKLSDWPYFSQFTNDMWVSVDTFFESHNMLHLMKNHLPFYFNHLIEKGAPLVNYFKALVACLHMTEITANPFSNRSHEKLALETFGMILEPLSESNLFSYMCLKYVEWILDYNKRNTKTTISVTKYANIIRFFVASLYDEATNVLYACFKQFEYEQFDAAFWKNFKLRVDEHILIWYNRVHPEKLIENMEMIFSEIDYKVEIFLKDLYNNPQQEVINAYKEYALNALNKNDYEKSEFAVLYLSIFLQSEFYNVADLLVPSPDGKMHAGTSYEKVLLQKAVARGLRNTFNYERKLALIKKYCVGYYVKYCFGTFYSVCATTPESALSLFLKGLDDATIQKHVRGAFKAFCSKLDVPVYAKCKTSDLLTTIESLSSEDALHHLQNLSKSATWYNKCFKLINEITVENIQKWDIEILKFLIKAILFADEQYRKFPCKCIYSLSGDNRSNLLQFTINLFTDYVNSNRDKFRKSIEFHNDVSLFIINFCKLSLNSKENKNVIDELLLKCPTIFEPEHVINAYLVLELTALYLESDFVEEEFGRKTYKLMTLYVEKYTEIIIDIFAKGLKHFLRIRKKQRSEIFDLVKFVNGILAENFNVVVAVLICQIVSGKRSDDNFKQVMDKLKSCQDPVVRYHLLSQETNYYV